MLAYRVYLYSGRCWKITIEVNDFEPNEPGCIYLERFSGAKFEMYINPALSFYSSTLWALKAYQIYRQEKLRVRSQDFIIKHVNTT